MFDVHFENRKQSGLSVEVLTQGAFGTALTAAGSGYSSCAAYLNEPPTGKDGFAPFVEENGGPSSCKPEITEGSIAKAHM